MQVNLIEVRRMRRMTNPRTPAFLDVDAVARRYDVRPTTVWAWARQGTLPQPIRLTAGCSRWSLKRLEQWENEREAASGKTRREFEERERSKRQAEAKA